MAEATQEMIALARTVAATELRGCSAWAEFYHDAIIRGDHDGSVGVRCALAAIQATTERAAKLADGWNAKRRDRATETGIAAALRDGAHLKEQSA